MVRYLQLAVTKNGVLVMTQKEEDFEELRKLLERYGIVFTSHSGFSRCG